MRIFLVLLLFCQSAFADKPDLFLLKNYDKNKAIIGWVMSEKLDGIRGFWDGKKLLTRGGKVLNPPKWFTKNYPPFAIDGELWTRRADFENISSIVRSQDSGERWREISHQIFEVPKQSGGLLERLSVLRAYLAKNPNPFIKIITQTPIKSKQQLGDSLGKITRSGGEGLVVRDSTTPYQTGRLASALKVKKYIDDECIVIKILGGKGKYLGKMGSLQCRLKNGNVVKIGSGFNDNERGNPPKIGTQITFKYYGLTKKGKHKYPVYLRKRLTN